MPPLNPAQRRTEPLVRTLPDTEYIRGIMPGMTLRDYATYVESERRNAELGALLARAMVVPLDGKLFYSPGGAAIVERARERLRLAGEDWKHVTDDATAKWARAAVFSPGTAVLGLGQVDENLHGMLMAGAAGPIMIGKSAYFLWTAGVNAEPVTVETPFQYTEIEQIVEAMVDDSLKLFSTTIHEEVAAIIKALNDRGINVDFKDLLLLQIQKAVRDEFFAEINKGKRNWKREEVSFPKQRREEFAGFVAEKIQEFFLKHAEGSAKKDDLGKRLKRITDDHTSHLRARIFAETVRKMANNYGFINIEDARGADLPIILGMLESMQLETAIWSDDKQGTGVITAASLLSWAEQTGRLKQDAIDPNRPVTEQKPLEGVRVIIFGAGAGAMGVYDELINMGVRHEDILVTDTGVDKDRSGRPHPLHEGRNDVTADPYKMRMRQGIKKGTTIEEFAKTADVVLNLGDVSTTTFDTPWLGQINKSLRAKPLMGYMTNPDPGVKPKDLFDVREDAYYASGNQLYENIVNNFTAFGYIGLGALLAGAKFINKEMTVAAAWAIHRVAQMGPTEERKQKLIADDKPEQAEYGQHWIVPDPTDLRLLEEQAVAVAMAAARSGVSIYLGANPTTVALEEFEIFVRQEVKYRKKEIAEMRKRAFETALVHYKERFPDRFAPFYLEDDKLPVFYINPVIEPNHFTNLRAQLGVEEKRLAPYMTKKGTMRPKALSYALDKLKAKLKDSALEAWEKKMAYKELVIIKNLALISPALGLALAIRKLQSWEKLDREGRPFDSIFSKYRIKDVIVELVPKATAAIDEFEKELVKYNKGTPPPVPAAPATPTAPAGTGEGAPPVVPPVAGAATLTMASSSSPSASPAITQASGELTAGSGDEIERLVRQKAAGNWQFLYHLSKNPRALKDAISAAGKPGLSPSQVAREAHASLLAKFANRRPTLWGGMPTLSSPLASGRLGKVVTRTLARN